MAGALAETPALRAPEGWPPWPIRAPPTPLGGRLLALAPPDAVGASPRQRGATRRHLSDNGPPSPLPLAGFHAAPGCVLPPPRFCYSFLALREARATCRALSFESPRGRFFSRRRSPLRIQADLEASLLRLPPSSGRLFFCAVIYRTAPPALIMSLRA
ncbi:hypothetical protein MTO96_020381 [Rhipicephalus appendiculatus]